MPEQVCIDDVYQEITVDDLVQQVAQQAFIDNPLHGCFLHKGASTHLLKQVKE